MQSQKNKYLLIDIMMQKIFRMLFIILVLSGLLVQVNAQTKEGKKFFDKAMNALIAKEFDKAIEFGLKAQKADPTFGDVDILLGDVYSVLENFNAAAQCYEAAMPKFSPPKPILYYLTAESNFQAGYYEKALKNYQAYLAIEPDVKLLKGIDKNISTCKFAIESIKNPVDLNPINMGEAINNVTDEYFPRLTADESEIIVTVRRPKDENTICAFCTTEEDFYQSVKSDEAWGARAPLTAINSHYNEGAQTISPDGKYLFFTLCNTDYGYGSCDLYYSNRIGGRWSRPKNFGQPVNTPTWESQPSVAPDGKTIYFTSKRPGGYGGEDIWKTTMLGEGRFSPPENLGPTINTPDNETAPFIHSDGKTLYFVSTGHVGMGGRDIFFSTKVGEKEWTEPINLGYPINTKEDELDIFINSKGNTAFYSSEKEGGFGGVDIYYFELDERLRPTPVTFMKGQVKDSQSGKSIEAEIELIDLENEELISATVSDPVTGEFLACIPTGTHLMMNISHPYYLFYSENFHILKSASELEPFLKDILLQKPTVGSSVVLNNIFFDFDKSELKPESFIELDVLLDFLVNNPTVKIEIGGHTDDQGGDTYNLQLSEARAKSVYQYLIGRNIDPERVTYRGYGETQPIQSNETEEGRAANRRTEIKIIAN